MRTARWRGRMNSSNSESSTRSAWAMRGNVFSWSGEGEYDECPPQATSPASGLPDAAEACRDDPREMPDVARLDQECVRALGGLGATHEVVGGVKERLGAQALVGQLGLARQFLDVVVDVVHYADTEEHDVASGHLLGEGDLLELVALHHVLGLRAPAGDRCAVHGGVQLAGDDDGIGVAADLTDGSGLTGLAEMVGGGLLVLVGQPDMVAELVRRDLGDVLDAVDEVVRGVRLARALDERDGVVGGRRLGLLEVDLHGWPVVRRGHG